MAKTGVNKVILIGNLGQDPEIRYLPNGTAVASVSLATSESWKDKTTGEAREQTEWHRLVFYRKLAEIVGEYLKKGASIYVQGRLHTRKWQDQTGQDRYMTEIQVDDLLMLDRRNSDSSHNSEGFRSSTRGGAKPAAVQAPSASIDDLDDEIPF